MCVCVCVCIYIYIYIYIYICIYIYIYIYIYNIYICTKTYIVTCGLTLNPFYASQHRSHQKVIGFRVPCTPK